MNAFVLLRVCPSLPLLENCGQQCFTRSLTNFLCTQASDTKRIPSFRHRDLIVDALGNSDRKTIPVSDNMRFGSHFSDHMLEIEWAKTSGWTAPRIVPLHNLVMHPAAKALHYAIQLFEGLKAYRGIDNKIRLFRPELNMRRMLNSAKRLCLPEFDCEELLKCLEDLIRLDREWVPYSAASSLYIRPTMIGTDPTLGVGISNRALLYVIIGPVSAYFPTGFKPIGLYADPTTVRSWPGGPGQYKLGSNYGPTIQTSKRAQELGCQQVLWLFSEDHYITEVGTMNIFVLWKNEKGERELVTPPLESGLILPGITRKCVLELSREWNEFKVSERPIKMAEITTALRENRVQEIFGAGTACIVAPVDKILYHEDGRMHDFYIPTMDNKPTVLERLFDTITGIQYGKFHRPDWIKVIDE